MRECPDSAWRVLSAEEPGSPFHVRCSWKALGDSVRPGSTSAVIHGSRVSHQAPPAASRPLGHPGLESCGGDFDVMGAHICHLLTDVPCALTEPQACAVSRQRTRPRRAVRWAARRAARVWRPGRVPGPQTQAPGRVSDPLPGPRAGRPHRKALTPPFTHGETEAQTASLPVSQAGGDWA